VHCLNLSDSIYIYTIEHGFPKLGNAEERERERERETASVHHIRETPCINVAGRSDSLRLIQMQHEAHSAIQLPTSVKERRERPSSRGNNSNMESGNVECEIFLTHCIFFLLFLFGRLLGWHSIR
jgi:hypothetical protein